MFRKILAQMFPATFGLRGKTASASLRPGNNGAVIVHIKLSNDEFGASGEALALHSLEDELEAAIQHFGELDGHDVGQGYFGIYFYGASSVDMLQSMRAILSRNTIPLGSFVETRDGSIDDKRIRMDLPFPDAPVV